MSKFLFTQSSLAKLAHPTEAEAGSAKYVIHWDSKSAGLGLLCRPSGVRTFILIYRTAAGRPRRMKLGRLGRITIDHARQLAARHNGDVAFGRDPAKTREDLRQTCTMDELFASYVSWLEGKYEIGERSHNAVRSAKRVRKNIAKPLGHKLVTEITDDIVVETLARFERQPGVFNSIRAYIGSAWNWGRSPDGKRRVPKAMTTPVEFVLPKPGTPRARRITPDEYNSVFKAVDKLMAERRNDPSRLLACLFVIRTGCRPIESVRLIRANINRKLGVITLDEHKTFRRTGKVKTFFITKEIVEILDRAEALHRTRGDDSDFVFHRRSKQQASNWLAKTWESIQKAAPTDITLGQFRSGFINTADDAGFTKEQVAAMTQHMSLTTVDRHYRVIDPKSAAENAAKVTATMGNVVPLRRAGSEKAPLIGAVERRACITSELGGIRRRFNPARRRSSVA